MTIVVFVDSAGPFIPMQPGKGHAARSPALVGRDAELATAWRLVDAVKRSDGATLLVTGEAGIGKSRLVAEVAARAATTGLTVLTGRTVQGGGTYRAVAEALNRPLRQRPLLDSARLRPYRAALGRLVPGWAEPGQAVDPGHDLGLDPTVVLAEGLLALLQELHGGAGCMLVLEDLHWADANTLGLLGYLVDAVPGAPVLLALTARDDVAAPGVAELTAHSGVTTLPLTRLKPAAVVTLATACRGGAPLPEPQLRQLVARSEGLPFLVEELLDSSGPPSRLPPTLAGLVAQRLATLSAAQRPVLVAAAVVGGDPDWRLLGSITDAAEQAVLDALRAAVAVGLLTAEGGQLRWRHSLTREAVLATLLPPERAALAARAARVLDARGDPEDQAAAAELFLVAGQPQRATEILLELARFNAARGALRSAQELLGTAAGTGRLVGAVAAERVQVLTMLGRVTEALEVGTTALEAGSLVGDEHAEICLRLARAAVASGRWSTAEGYLERAGRPRDPRCLVVAADAAFGAGDVGRAAALATAAVHAAERDGTRPETLCEALTVIARSTLPDIAAGESASRRAAQVAAEHGLIPWRVEALFGLGTFELSAGSPNPPSFAAARELAVQAGMLGKAVQLDLLRADVVLLVDGPRAARPFAQRVADRAGELRLPGLQAMGELWAASGAAATSDLPAMTALLDAAASRAHAPVEIAALTPVIRALPHLLAHDLPTAAVLVNEGISRLLQHASAAPIGYFGLWVLLRTVVADRDRAAREALRGHHSMIAVSNQAALHYAEAIAHGRAGHPAEAAAQFAAADALLGRFPWWQRLLRLLALEAALTDGWGNPVPALRADLAAHEQVGDAGLARTCRDLLRAAGAPTRRGRGNSPVSPTLRAHGITSREVDVLILVTAGLTNAQVATRLYLSPRTVETHVTNLLAKTSTTSRAELRAWAAAHDLPPLTP
ncbi:MAG TPA: AAA family ATPase [Pseudonocardiaceae bacterium]|nr:AAA family ATPase [Pseudonocardiaceae bacterium]